MSDRPLLTPSVVLRLSQDELATILQLHHIDLLPGFDIPEDFNSDHADAATRGLLARGLANYRRDESIVINEGVVQIATLAARSQRLLLISHQSDETASWHWFYLNRDEFAVYHGMPMRGVHQFQTLNDGVSMLTQWSRILGLAEDVHAIPDDIYALGRAAYDQARLEARRGDSDGALAILESEGLPFELASAVVNPRRSSIVSSTGLNGSSPQANVMVVLQTDDDIWGLYPQHMEVTVRPANSETILVQIADLLK